MRVTAPQLRTVLLAQAIEHADSGHTLVSPPALEEATRSAVAAARARGVQRVGVGDVVLQRAAAIADHASTRDATVAALKNRGVKFEVCEITLKNRNLKREQFIPEADFTPSGVVRLTENFLALPGTGGNAGIRNAGGRLGAYRDLRADTSRSAHRGRVRPTATAVAACPTAANLQSETAWGTALASLAPAAPG